MSLTTKTINNYSKALFNNVNKSQESKTKSLENPELTFAEKQTIALNYADVYIIGEELSLLRATIISSTKLKEFFKNPTYLEELKLEVILGIFPGLTLQMKAFLLFLTERSHLSLIPEICEQYHRYLLKFKNWTKVKIITATVLNQSSGTVLLKALKTLTSSNQILLSFTYNPKILGGIIIEHDSVSTDASILKEFSLFFSE